MTALRRDFLKFHKENPWVFENIERHCRELWNAYWRTYSMRTIISVIRFDRDLKTGGAEVPIEGSEDLLVKINNNHSPYYARMLAYKHPTFERFFNYRRVDGEQDGEIILFSDDPSEPDRRLGTKPPQRQPRLQAPAPNRPGIKLKPPKRTTGEQNLSGMSWKPQ